MKLITKTSLGLAAILSANAAMADWYVSGSIGYTNVSDQLSTGPNREVDAEYDSDTGYSVAVGYSYPQEGAGSYRTEIEYRRNSNDVDQLAFNNVDRIANGDISSQSLFFNGYYDFTGLHDQWVPYIGAGIGMTRVDVDVQYGAADFNGDDTVLALQAIAGITYKASDNLSLYSDLRYHVAQDPDLNRFGGPAPAANVELDSEYDTYSLNLGVRYNF